MPSCAKCSDFLGDGADCNVCKKSYHFPCAGITESGFRKLGEEKRKNWRCPACKQSGSVSLAPVTPRMLDTTMDITPSQIMVEIKNLASKLAPLDSLVQDVKSLKNEITNLKKSVDNSNNMVQEFSKKIKLIEERIAGLESTKTNVASLHLKIEKMEHDLELRDQWARSNNAEIKGIPMAKDENLFNILEKISVKIQYVVDKNQINYITRVPTRDPNHTKPIIVCFNNKYVKENFIAAARTKSSVTPLMAADLGFQGKQRIYVNDHLTTWSKMLLSKTKSVAKERNFLYVWVKHSKILVRKDTTSPIIAVKSEKDLTKLS